MGAAVHVTVSLIKAYMIQARSTNKEGRRDNRSNEADGLGADFRESGR